MKLTRRLITEPLTGARARRAGATQIWGEREPRALGIGYVVAGKYELARLLGRGSMGEVWVARHHSLDEQVALKLLIPAPEGGELEDHGTAAARFRFEAQVAARLSRKTRHIVRVTDHGQDEGLSYLVMELLDGETLETALMRRSCMSPADASKLVTQIARGLAEAHAEGVLHRDLKPANVFLARDDNGELLVKLLDFGIAGVVRARRVTGTFATATGLVFGTPGYMSPEQVSECSELDNRADLWALATIAYEALTGELPIAGFDAEELLANLRHRRIVPLRERSPALPASLDPFFERAFGPRAADRHATAMELAAAFEEACTGRAVSGERAYSGHAVSVERPPRVAMTERTPTRPWAARALIAVAATLVVVAAAGTAWRRLVRPPVAVVVLPTVSVTAPTATPDSSLPASPVSPGARSQP